MSNKTQRALIAVLTVVIALVVLVTVVRMATTPRDTPPKGMSVAPVVSDPTPSPDLVMDGTWKSAETAGSSFVATVKNNTITVIWKMPDTSEGLYWVGDFPSKIISGAASTGVISNADQAQLAKSVVGSQSEYKEFTYEGDVLSFDFTAMGVTKKVELKK
jgi:hypothetical protein